MNDHVGVIVWRGNECDGKEIDPVKEIDRVKENGPLEEIDHARGNGPLEENALEGVTDHGMVIYFLKGNDLEEKVPSCEGKDCGEVNGF